MTMEQANQLYGKYVGNWGGDAITYRFDAIKGGVVVKSVTKEVVREIRLAAHCYRTELVENETYDVAAIRIVAEDQNGNHIPYFQEPVLLKVDGPAQLIGPSAISLKGGTGGTYIKTVGEEGEAVLHIVNMQAGEIKISFNIKVNRTLQI